MRALAIPTSFLWTLATDTESSSQSYLRYKVSPAPGQPKLSHKSPTLCVLSVVPSSFVASIVELMRAEDKDQTEWIERRQRRLRSGTPILAVREV